MSANEIGDCQPLGISLSVCPRITRPTVSAMKLKSFRFIAAIAFLLLAPLSLRASEILELTTDDQADAFAAMIIQELQNAGSDEMLVVRIAQLQKDGSTLNRYLKRAIIRIDAEATRLGLRQQLELGAYRVEQNEVETAASQFEDALTEETKVGEYLLRYEQLTDQAIDGESKSKIKSYFSRKNIKERIRSVIAHFFGNHSAKNGVTVTDHFVEKKIVVRGDEIRTVTRSKTGWRKPWKLALSTSVIAMTSFTLGTTLPGIGFLDFGSVDHIRATAVIGAWVFTCLSFVQELASLKGQGKAVVLQKPALAGGNELKISPNYRMFLGWNFIQELIAASVISAGIMGAPSFLEADAWTYLFSILMPAIAGSLSNTFFELWASPYWVKQVNEYARSEELRDAGNETEADEALASSKRAGKRAGWITNLWYNLGYPAARWSGAMGGQTGQSLAARFAGWFASNRGFLTVIGITTLVRAWQNRILIGEWAERVYASVLFGEKRFKPSCNLALVSLRKIDSNQSRSRNR